MDGTNVRYSLQSSVTPLDNQNALSCVVYYRCENREWIVEENEAEVIRRIFREYVSGKPITAICSELEADGIPSSGGKTAWRGKAVLDILHNEKYIGDVRMQKSFISDPIQHIRTDNRDAKLKQYYKENHHPAIIDRETYDMAQKMIAMRSTNQGFSQYPFYGVLKCPICGANMVRFATLRDTASYGWTCGGNFTERGNLREDRTVCPPYCFSEDLLTETYWESMRALDEFELRRLADKQDGKAAVARTILERRAAAGDTFPKIAYKDLCDLVERISFPKWSKLRIQWKCGLSTEVEMNISKATDHPYPRITREVVEHKTRKGDYEAESRSISENVKWSYRRLAEMGVRHVGNNHMLGYDEVNGKLTPNKDAWMVRQMFRDYAAGLAPSVILQHLQETGAKRMHSDRNFTWSSVLTILRNEAYVGDRRLQKTAPQDFLTKKPDPMAEYEEKYLRDDHEGIVSMV